MHESAAGGLDVARGPGAAGAAVTVVDAANVIGARPDGWWRDRAKAAQRLVAAVTRAHAATGAEFVVVLEGAGRNGVEPDEWPGVAVVHAAGSGDDEIVRLVAAATGPVTVVTSDRGLCARVTELGAETLGAGTFRESIGE